MDFIAHDFWSGAWLASLAFAGVVTLAGSDAVAKRILAILCVNFLATRSIVFWALPDFLWVINDLVATVALALCGRTIAARASALLFFIILQFDLAMFFGWASFAPVAAVSDLLGYIILVVMMSAAHGNGGGKYSDPVDLRRGGYDTFPPVALRRSSPRRYERGG